MKHGLSYRLAKTGGIVFLNFYEIKAKSANVCR